MNNWEHDKVEIERHWDKLDFFCRFIILFVFPLLPHKKTESIGYIMNRLFTRPDRMVCVEENKWDSIYNFLRNK